MKDILYHDNTVKPSCDESGKFLNNWNADGPFEEGEFVTVYFRIRTPGYYHPDRQYSEMCMFDSQEERAAFYNEIGDIFTGLDWTVTGLTNLDRDKSHLYVHPQEISGVVEKWEVAFIAEKLAAKANLFNLLWVDLYQTVYFRGGDSETVA